MEARNILFALGMAYFGFINVLSLVVVFIIVVVVVFMSFSIGSYEGFYAYVVCVPGFIVVSYTLLYFLSAHVDSFFIWFSEKNPCLKEDYKTTTKNAFSKKSAFFRLDESTTYSNILISSFLPVLFSVWVVIAMALCESIYVKWEGLWVLFSWRVFVSFIAITFMLLLLKLVLIVVYEGGAWVWVYAPKAKSIKEYTAIKVSLLIIPYVFIGFFFSGVYVQVGYGFNESILEISDAIYFSFVTLTTLGYGEIHPTISSTKFLVIIESLIGVVYLSMIIGVSVGYGLSLREGFQVSGVGEKEDKLEPEE